MPFTLRGPLALVLLAFIALNALLGEKHAPDDQGRRRTQFRLAELGVIQADVAKDFDERRTGRVDKIIDIIGIEPIADVERKFAHGGRAER